MDDWPEVSEEERLAGLTQEQLDWVYEMGRTNYGTAEVSESGIDISQLRNNRKRTPEQRLEAMIAGMRNIVELRGIARRSRKDRH